MYSTVQRAQSGAGSAFNFGGLERRALPVGLKPSGHAVDRQIGDEGIRGVTDGTFLLRI